MKHLLRLLIGAVAAVLLTAGIAQSAFAATPFTTLASGFTQNLYATGLSCCGGVAFASDGDPLFVSSAIYDISATNTTTMNGSTVHTVSILTPLAPLFFGVVNVASGAIYANTGSGVYEIDSAGNILAGPYGPPGNGLGITVDPQTGDLVYPDANGNISWVNQGFTASGTFAVGATSDGLVFDPTGDYLFAAEFGSGIDEYNRSGTLVQNIPNSSSPDGMAFHSGSPVFMVSNNNDGSITRYDFPNGDYTQAPTQSVFASGGFRGDLTQVGTDGCLYATQGGTRFADGTTTTDGSLVQICPGFIPPAGAPTSPLGAGYWKTHLTRGTPNTQQYLSQSIGGFAVSDTTTAGDVLTAMNCSNSSAQNAIGCLAGQLLTVELNLANQSDTCIQNAVTKANAWLSGTTEDGVPGTTYSGPSATYTLTQAERTEALTLAAPLENYDSGGGC